jgi:hypothetical protein
MEQRKKIMKWNWKTTGSLLILILAVDAVGRLNAQVYTGTKIGKNGGLSNYHLSMGNYFNVAEKEILSCGQKNILEEELPVVFLMAQKSGSAPEVIASRHAGGVSWMNMARHFNLSPRIFYVPTGGQVKTAPYKKIYGNYQANKSRIQLSDPDIVNLVNLKFMSDHYGRDPREIIQMRSKGETFPDIDNTFKREKEDMRWDAGNTPLEVRDSKGNPDPRKGDRNSLSASEREQNR